MTGPGVDAVRAARAELDTVIEEIRAVDAFTQFLAPPTFDDVAGIATTPLVYLAAAELGGLALVVRDGDVTRVPLDTLTADAVRGRVETHLSAYTAYRADPTTAGAGWSEALSTVTRWLWEDAVGPVLDALGAAVEAVFVAGGLLGLLPLHAAWTPDGSSPTGRRYALDRLTISYAPNARALRAARERAALVPGRRLLSIVEPVLRRRRRCRSPASRQPRWPRRRAWTARRWPGTTPPRCGSCTTRGRPTSCTWPATAGPTSRNPWTAGCCWRAPG